MRAIDFLVGQMVVEIVEVNAYPYEEHSYRFVRLLLSNGMTIDINAADDINPTDPFFTLTTGVTL